tara:strand:+ start:39699 stop:39929 length:231 start_codon:yes stop_codon:yes gene_type:complete
MTKIIDSYHEVKEHILLNGSNEQRDIILPHLDNLLAETQRLNRAFGLMLKDFDTQVLTPDMWAMRNRIESILKGDA